MGEYEGRGPEGNKFIKIIRESKGDSLHIRDFIEGFRDENGCGFTLTRFVYPLEPEDGKPAIYRLPPSFLSRLSRDLPENLEGHSDRQ